MIVLISLIQLLSLYQSQEVVVSPLLHYHTFTISLLASSSNKETNTIIIVVSVLFVILGVAALVVIFIVCWCNNNRKKFKEISEGLDSTVS